MKICILNLSGNVGKSTIAVHLFSSYIPTAKIISVESFNSSVANDVESVEVSEISASRYKDIYREILLQDDIIIDVGASNVSTFMSEITRFKSSVGEFDLIVVPTVPADKQQKDTIATLNWLHLNKIPANKIRLIFNQYNVDSAEAIEDIYAHVFGFLETDGKGYAEYKPYAVIAQNEIFEMVKPTGKTIKDLGADKTNWAEERKKAKAAGDIEKLESVIENQILHDLALSASDNLDEVFKIIIPKK